MQRKLDQYQEVYTYLRERPVEESNGILQRIRDGWDVLELCNFIHEGQLLLHSPPSFSNISPNMDPDMPSTHPEPDAPS